MICVKFYGDYNEARKAGIKFDLPPLMKTFWSDGTIYFLVYVQYIYQLFTFIEWSN